MTTASVMVEPAHPSIDRHVLDSLGLLDDPESLQELFGIYLSDTKKRMEEIRTELAQDKIDWVVRAAHTLKGSSANLGLSAIAHIADSIVTIVRSETPDLQKAGQELVGLGEEFLRIQHFMKNEYGYGGSA
ncbi:MAG: Hpt domain-containing protein [candidate division Zixibacteria bacterium]|nr:Hpt domain-containing protein [candidate division Zixibacteria bacterium]